jgi:hypothetical protein
VVLSACQTNVGAVSAGDEVVGLTRAFLFAGTPTVISSLWNVDDKATTVLMERFYTHLRAGMGKAQALQQAQRDVRAQYPHPYYWASFVLTGSAGTSVEVQATPPNATTTPMQRPNMSGVLLLGLCSLGFLAALLGGIAYRRRKKVGL